MRCCYTIPSNTFSNPLNETIFLASSLDFRSLKIQSISKALKALQSEDNAIYDYFNDQISQIKKELNITDDIFASMITECKDFLGMYALQNLSLAIHNAYKSGLSKNEILQTVNDTIHVLSE